MTLRDEFPPNNNEPKRLSRIVKGPVLMKKKGLLDGMTSLFFGETGQNVIQYILTEIVIPSAKETIVDMVKGGLELWFYGDSVNSRSNRLSRDNRGRTIVNYSNISSSRRPRTEREITRIERPVNRQFENLVFPSRADAEDVLETLVDHIEMYGLATVADFLDLSGLSTEPTDFRYGWDNLNSAVVRAVRSGYILDMPRPSEIS